MDNDDNDYQGQNRDLESSKISSVLCPYALPKFDFDDNLRAHSRFDGLIENEVFLGIPSQEDNHWMEDFSRGSSGMEFSSSAAESCSIPRHNNVWSEATSSESVEMLLKSVGQEEMVPGVSVIEKSKAVGEFGSLEKQMEPNFGQDEKCLVGASSRPEEVCIGVEEQRTQNDDSGAIDEHLSSSHDSQLNVASTVVPAQEYAVETDATKCEEASGVPESEESFLPTAERNNEDLHSVAQSCLSSVILVIPEAMEIKESADKCEKSSVASQGDGGDAANSTMSSRVESHGIHHDMELANISVGSHNPTDGVTSDTTSVTYVSTVDCDLHKHVNESSINHADDLPCLTSTSIAAVFVAEKQVIENSNENNDAICRVDCEVNEQVNESSINQVDDLCNLTVIENPNEMDDAIPRVDCEVNEQVNESSIHQVDDLCNMTVIENPNEMDDAIPRVDCEVNEQVNESSIHQVDDLCNLTNTSVSAEIHLIKNPKENNAAAGVQSEAVPSVQAGMQISIENISSHKIGVLNNDPDVSVHEKGDLMNVDSESVGLIDDANKLSSSSVDREFRENIGAPPGFKLINDSMRLLSSPFDKEVSENVGGSPGFKLINDAKTLPFSSLEKEVRENVGGPPGFKLHDPMTNESVSNAGVNNTNLISRETSDTIPSLSPRGVNEKVTNSNEEQGSPSRVVVVMDVDEKLKREVEAHPEAIPNLKESLCVEGEPHTASDGEKSTSSNVVVEIVSREDQTTLSREMSNTAIQDEIVVADTTRQESIDRIKLDPVHCGSKLADTENAEAVATKKHQDTKEENYHGVLYPEAPDGGNMAESEPCNVLSKTEKSAREGPTEAGLAKVVLSGSRCEVGGRAVSTPVSKPSDDSASVINCTEFSKTEEKIAQEGSTEAGLEKVVLSGSRCEVGGKAVSTPVSGAVNNTSRDERSFTFDVRPLAGLSEGETGMGWQSFPSIKPCNMPTTEKGSASTYSNNQKNHGAVQDTSHAVPRAPEIGSPSEGAKSTSERKTRRGSGKTGKDSGKKGGIVKETPVNQSERENKQCTLESSSGTVQLRQFEVVNTERSVAKPPAVVSAPASNLPDLNTSVPPSVLFHQPFTDLQQVQLRAQIFVYGNLIQGAAPDETCMVSAFGTSDGGRSLWVPSWRACVERLRGQESIVNNYDTPVQSRTGSKVQAHSSKQGSPQTKVPPSPASRLSSKGTPSPAVNPVMPLSSPLWNISTPSCAGLPSSSVARGAVLDYQAPPPLHSYHTPPMRTFGSRTTSWLSQAGPWVTSPQISAYDFGARFSLPSAETMKLTPVIDPSLAITSCTTHVSATPAAHGGSSSTFGPSSSMLDNKKTTGSPVQHSATPKSRKRKKSNIIEDPVISAALVGAVSFPLITSHSSNSVPANEKIGPISLLARDQMKPVSVPIVSGHFSTSVAVTAPMSSSDKFLVASSPALVSTVHSKRGNSDKEKTDIHAEAFRKVEEAQRHAEEAAADAASAVCHCQSVWGQLDKQRNSGLPSEIEVKLASAAVAIAAAASVAKAAAAATKIASSAAAVLAKQMANEALISNETNMSAQESLVNLNNLGNATPASILKAVDKGSNSITAAASRRAENLNAIVKAAELAAEAVSQAGKIVDMGESLPLSELVEAGPERYWRASEVPSEEVVKHGTQNGDKEVPKQSEGPSDQEMRSADQGRSHISIEIFRNLKENNIRIEEDTSASAGRGDEGLSGGEGHKEPDPDKASMPESGSGFIQGAQESGTSISIDNGMKEGCLVEVFKDGGCFKGAWYSANVLNLDSGKVFVCYTELQSEEGSALLREWVPLEEGSEVPIIRIPHPMSSMRFGRTRKRRRAAVREYNWAVGEKVDAWIEDCWREGVIKEKNKQDDTSLTVHFPAQGETSVVRAWHLRPTLMWKNGEWIELASSGENASSQGDTPQEKRQKLGSPAIEVKGKGKISTSMDIVESVKEDEPKLLPLSASEKVFNIGSNRDENKGDGPRVMRSGLQKEGSKVIFGVPKPGKKRKFMDVSKHYVSEGSTKNSLSNDLGKSSKYSVPLGAGSRGWNKSSKINPKEKVAEFKSKALRSGKLPIVSSRTLPQKGNSGAAMHGTTSKSLIGKDSSSSDISESRRKKVHEFGSVTNSEAAAEHAKKASTKAKSERLTKGNLVPAGGKSTKAEVKDKSTSDDAIEVEPRRSNRKIQPTARLLEGLQTSLTISKIPSFSYDRSKQNHNKGASRGTQG